MAPVTGRRILRRSITRNRRRLTAGTGLISLHQLAEAAVPVLIGVGIDRAVAPGDGTALLLWVAALGALFTGLHLCYRFGARQLMLAIAGEAYLLRGELAAKIMHPRRLRTDLRAGELLTVSSTDADNVSYLLDYVPRIAGAVTATGVSAAVLLAVDWRLGLVVLVGTPVVLVGMQFAGPLITRRVTEQQELAGKATALATDLVSGVRPLRGLGAERAAARRYRDVSQASLRAALRAAATTSRSLAFSTTGSALLACGVAVLAGWFALDGRISVGEFIMVIGLAQFLLEPIGLLAIVPSWVAEARASADRAALVLGADLLLPEGAARQPVPVPDLVLRGVRHGSLEGLDLTVRPGELLGIVTPRAADGEALVRLLAGGVPPGDFEGGILVGGVPLHDLAPAAARAALLVEPHHTDLFTGTVTANVTARTGATDPAPERTAPADPAALREALAASAADRVVTDHPDGLDRHVEERGLTLSGGQRQRLALARALLARPPILVLHDPTTAVDTVTEQSIARAVRALRHGDPAGGRYTTVVVTSSPALLAVTDRVVVVDDGRVTAEGGHAELGAHDDYRKVVLR
ncbi:ABC transporter ATP-binding protein [Dactylosporangium aurantiacum]|uniref:ABC transporter ATP-binding protein n=1 Tax=Dactylosporangium aurantiacum TaxID=35754 RepID=A0A9Q9IEL7_9ACTN|nr:ABC transporter ATP-binding protein [Dactylosporangium aurantiacum]MDG6107899.1 ABC transporter ATP-binding protein [Dactylosporangium aurantiacum]UWZ51793.1 ABC transporter ATP-binding protein [Dactylosporangium aurantiacum]